MLTPECEQIIRLKLHEIKSERHNPKSATTNSCFAEHYDPFTMENEIRLPDCQPTENVMNMIIKTKSPNEVYMKLVRMMSAEVKQITKQTQDTAKHVQLMEERFQTLEP